MVAISFLVIAILFSSFAPLRETKTAQGTDEIAESLDCGEQHNVRSRHLADAAERKGVRRHLHPFVVGVDELEVLRVDLQAVDEQIEH